MELHGIAEHRDNFASSIVRNVLNSKAKSTNNKYFRAFSYFTKFCIEKGFSDLPCNAGHVACFLSKLIDENLPLSQIQTSFFSIKWAHSISGFKDPTQGGIISSLLGAAKRKLGKPHVAKDAVTSADLVKLCVMYEFNNDLKVRRDLSMLTLAFAGFLRFSELASLRLEDLVFKPDHLELRIKRSKTDQEGKGETVFVSKGVSQACPLLQLERYLDLAKISRSDSNFVFRPLYRFKGKAGLIRKDKPLSYTRVRETLVGRLKEVMGEGCNLGLHSLRAGGCTAASERGVDSHLVVKHGRWRHTDTKNIYVRSTLSERLEVSKNLGL